MTVGDRIKARLEALGISQSALAREVGITQATIAALISGKSRSSTHLHKIARALVTTPAYLSGEMDDPDENAPPPPPVQTIQHVMMAVAMPSEAALARMFLGLLKTLPAVETLDEQALLLAKRLPIALSQLRGLFPESHASTTAPADCRSIRSTPSPKRTKRPPI